MALVFEQIVTEGLGDASYLVGDDSAGVAAVVDPLADVERYLALAHRHGLAITHVLQTHVHEDFASGANALAKRLGDAEIGVGGQDAPAYGYAHRPLRDGERLAFGTVVLTVRHTPGHTPEHVAVLVAEADTPDDPWGVLSGGALLVGSAGRCDLLGPERAEALARAQFRTLRRVFLALPDGVAVYPAHVHGSPCGAALGERDSSTIGHERQHNPLLQAGDEDAFVRLALDGLPPKPSYYPRLKEANTRGDAAPPLQGMRPLAVEDFERACRAQDVQLVDTRDQLAFGGGHIEGALNLGASGKLSIWAGWMLDAEQPLLLVLDDDSQLDMVVQQFRRTGFHRFAGYLAGGMAAWRNAGKPLRSLPQWPVQRLHEELSRCTVLDVRSPEEWSKGHVPGARHVFLPELPQRLGELPADKPLAVYCDSGYRASLGASLLQRQGFERVASVPGSWQAWQGAKLPVER